MSGFAGTFLSHEEIQSQRMPMYVKPQSEHREEIPMDTTQKEFDRLLPEGATVSKTGKVWKKGMELVPCPKCPGGWKAPKSEKCGACWTRATKEEGGPKAIKAKKAKALSLPPSSPMPLPTSPATRESVVEELAQRYAEKIRARALEILGMGS